MGRYGGFELAVWADKNGVLNEVILIIIIIVLIGIIVYLWKKVVS